MRAFAIILVLFAVIGGGGYALREYAPQYLPDGMTTDEVLRERMRAQIMEDEQAAAFYTRFETLFPADHNELMTQLVALSRRGGTEEQAMVLGTTYMRSFLEDNRRHVAAAQPAALVELGASFADSLRVLQQENVGQCAQSFRTGNFSFDVEGLSDEAKASLIRVTNAVLDAVASGMRTPAQYADPTEAQLRAWLARYEANGGDTATLEAFGSPGHMAALPPEAVCGAAEDMWVAVLQAEDDFAARFMAMSIRQQQP